ncbi:MAG: AMP-binding protein [Nocardioides sp.]
MSTDLMRRTSSRTGIDFATRIGEYGERPALITSRGVISYAALSDRVGTWRAKLGHRRLIVMDLHPTADSVAAYLAALADGHPVLLAPAGRADIRDRWREHYRPGLEIHGSAPSVTSHGAGTGDLHHELALLLSSSGTTGSPKLIRLSRSSVEANATAIGHALGLTPSDVGMTSLPLSYSYGLSVLHSHLTIGAAVALTEGMGTDHDWAANADAAGVTSLAVVPATLSLLGDPRGLATRLPSLRRVTVAGGRVSAPQVLRWAESGARDGWEFVVMYGQTEATARIAVLRGAAALETPWSLGHPIPGGRLRLAGDSTEGELVYSGPNVMLGYAEGPTDLARGREVDELRTGDVARIDALGRFELVGRISRRTKVAGLRVDLDQLERRLAEGGIDTLCTDDHKDGAGSLAIAACAVSIESVRDSVFEIARIPPGFLRIALVDALPRTAHGKPDYQSVRRMGREIEPVTAGGTDLERVHAAFAVVFGRPDIDVGESFATLNGDSLSHVELSLRLERAVGALPPDWTRLSIARLAERGSPGPRRWARIETSVWVRAVAIVLIVGSHANLFTLMGGAHVLIAALGFSFARFVADDRARTVRLRHALRATVRLTVPAMIWVAALWAVSGQYSWQNVLLVNTWLGSARWGDHWHLWFVEAVFYLFLSGIALLLAGRGQHYGAPLVLAAITSLIPLGVVAVPDGPGLRFLWYGVAWLFFTGWAAALTRSASVRAALTAIAVAPLAELMPTTQRALLVAAGVVLLIWVPHVPWPRVLTRPLAALAGSSLFIYLTHWQVYPLLEYRSPALAVACSLGLGVAVWWMFTIVVEQRPAAWRPSYRGEV